MPEQAILRGRANFTTTIYEAPSYGSAKVGEFLKGSLFRLVNVQREKDMNWCKVQTDDGRTGFMVGSLVDVCRECSTARRGVRIYDADRIQRGTLARGAALSAWLPPDSNLELSVGESDWIEVNRENGRGYVRGIRNLRVSPLPRVGQREPGSFSFIMPLTILLVVAGFGIVALIGVFNVVTSPGFSRAFYEISAVVIGSWLALKGTFGRRK